MCPDVHVQLFTRGAEVTDSVTQGFSHAGGQFGSPLPGIPGR
jgi:hypothetical protein